MREITGAEIVDVHAAIFGISQAEARDRVRDAEGLEAAAVRPANYRHYQAADPALQGAALAHAIAERQVFVDGNKRTALSSMGLFPALNGYTTSASDDERFAWMLRLAHGWGPAELGAAVRRTQIALDQSRHQRAPTVSEHIRRGRQL